ncbi:MAG: divalent-cation tolerance protein CutA [Leptospiraceae bacterium]|nr:divalent-cation tolerance protein CutA [Leptospiraceae bacterium]MCP5499137.1 divalent-cation tolerance protein CutA [Leptospiraceae bacterium]
MDTYCLIYITTSSEEEAQKLAKVLIEERLVACANLIKGMQSMYWWEGKVEYGEETILIVKTKENLFEEVKEKIKSLHSYSCPCILRIKIDGGNPAFLQWISSETKSEA